MKKANKAAPSPVSPTIFRCSAPPAAAPNPMPQEAPAEALLRETRPDELTPREALDLLYRLKALAAG